MSTICVPMEVNYAPSDEKKSPEGKAETNKARVKRQLVLTTIISTTTIKLYRLLIIVRMGILVLFFKWRLKSTITGSDGTRHAMLKASIAGELWFALMWVLEQLPKMKPVRRAVDVTALEESRLPIMDVMVTTADPEKEPPLTTVNTVLSILATDYPPDKLTCYVSDDGGALLMREVLAEASQFAQLWVPFCRKHGVEPRNPEAYFSPSDMGGDKARRVVKRGAYKGRAWPELARDRRRIRREYEELRLRINALQAGDIQRRRRCTADDDDHAGVVQVVIGPCRSHTPQMGGSGLVDLSSVDVRIPALVYVCRQKQPGRAQHKKAGAMNALLRASAVLSNAPFILNLDCDHYVNNSQALRAGACNVLDRGGEDVAFVQFPQRFDGVDPGDRYANHNRVFFDCTELGLDGVQGPIYAGTGCLFRRVALYGLDPPRWSGPPPPAMGCDAEPCKFGGSSAPFLNSVRAAFNINQQLGACKLLFDEAAIAEATALVSCGFEDKTAWGRDIGWIYGTVTEDVATGFCMHRRGWRSAYCATAPDAFRGTAPINLTDRLHQVLRWAAGSLEIFFSRNNALLAGRRLHPLQRVAYLNSSLYPFTSVVLLLYYCLISLVDAPSSGQDRLQTTYYMGFLAALMLTLAMVAVLEVRWSGIALRDWWRNQQFWMVSATSAYLAAVVQVALKITAGKEISFSLTSKQTAAGGGGNDRYAELYAVRWTVLMVPPTLVLMMNVASIVVAIESGSWRDAPGPALTVASNVWMVAHLYPFAQGLIGRWSTTWSPLLVLVTLSTVRLLSFILQSHHATTLLDLLPLFQNINIPGSDKSQTS